MGEWHLYKPSDSLGDKLRHQSQCSRQVHLQPAPPELCQPPSPKYTQLSSQPHILGLARAYAALPFGWASSKAENPGITPQPSMAPLAKLRKLGTAKLLGKVLASQHIKQPSGRSPHLCSLIAYQAWTRSCTPVEHSYCGFPSPACFLMPPCLCTSCYLCLETSPSWSTEQIPARSASLTLLNHAFYS